MKNIIVGTAGHIDHGKTALVKALTGIDADRLEEEKRRGITIDIGERLHKRSPASTRTVWKRRSAAASPSISVSRTCNRRPVCGWASWTGAATNASSRTCWPAG